MSLLQFIGGTFMLLDWGNVVNHVEVSGQFG